MLSMLSILVESLFFIDRQQWRRLWGWMILTLQWASMKRQETFTSKATGSKWLRSLSTGYEDAKIKYVCWCIIIFPCLSIFDFLERWSHAAKSFTFVFFCFLGWQSAICTQHQGHRFRVPSVEQTNGAVNEPGRNGGGSAVRNTGCTGRWKNRYQHEPQRNELYGCYQTHDGDIKRSCNTCTCDLSSPQKWRWMRGRPTTGWLRSTTSGSSMR